MNGNQARVQAGVPSGGQFTGRDRGEASVHLSVLQDAVARSNESFGDHPDFDDFEFEMAEMAALDRQRISA